MQGIVQAGAAEKINSAVCADNEFSLSALYFYFFRTGLFQKRRDKRYLNYIKSGFPSLSGAQIYFAQAAEILALSGLKQHTVLT